LLINLGGREIIIILIMMMISAGQLVDGSQETQQTNKQTNKDSK
tara:strand:+ start:97 stop:228 length:132 start_codon:yes stop_codon:yes gene_type:complete